MAGQIVGFVQGIPQEAFDTWTKQRSSYPLFVEHKVSDVLDSSDLQSSPSHPVQSNKLDLILLHMKYIKKTVYV